MGDDAGDEHLAFRQFGGFPDPPFMLVARIAGFERIGAGAHAEHDVDDVLQFHVVDARAHVDAVAGVVAHALGRNAAQRVVQELDAGGRPFAALGEIDLRVHRPVARQLRIVDLQDEAGVDDRPVFLVQRVGQRHPELPVGLVIFVGVPIGEVGRRDRRHEGFFARDPGKCRL